MIYVVVDNNNKLVLHYNHQKKEKYTSSTAILEGTPYTKFLNLVPCLILRIHRQRHAKTLDPGHPFLKTLHAGATSPKMLC